jgi:transcriptional regulator with XRE-family HTH domain
MNGLNPLRRLRKQLNATQSEAAKITGTTQATYCRWEKALDDATSPLAPKALEATVALRRAGVERFGSSWQDAWASAEGEAAPRAEQTDSDNEQTERANVLGSAAP